MALAIMIGDDYLLWEDAAWEIRAFKHHRTGRYRMAVHSKRKAAVDYPIKYADGRVAYDFPERLPAYVKRKARVLFKDIERLNKELHDGEA